jgi:DnaJ-domain-containing protein 1
VHCQSFREIPPELQGVSPTVAASSVFTLAAIEHEVLPRAGDASSTHFSEEFSLNSFSECDTLAGAMKPSASGSFEQTPFAHVVLYVWEHKLSGVLQIQNPNGAQYIIRSEEGVLTRGWGPIQAADPVLPLFLLDPKSRFAFYEGIAIDGPGQAHAFPTAHPWATVWQGLRRKPDWTFIQDLLRRALVRRAFRLRSDGASLEALGLDARERGKLDTLQGDPVSFSQFRFATQLGNSEAQLLVYFLLITKRLELSELPEASNDSLPPISMSPRSIPPVAYSTAPKAPSSRPQPTERTPDRTALSQSPRAPSVSPGGPSASGYSVVRPSMSTHSAVRGPDESPEPASAVRLSASSYQGARLTPNQMTKIRVMDEGRRMTPAEIVAVAVKRSGGSTPPPPPSLGPEDQARVKQILEMAGNLENMTHYEVMGVDRTTPTANVQLAYLGLVKQWHPDRLPKSLEFVKAQATRVFSRIAEAQAVLSDTRRREQYDRSLMTEVETKAATTEVERTLEALGLFQKAEAALKKGDSANALTLATNAVALDPKQADYLALKAWLEANEVTGRTPEGSAAAIEQMSKALRLNAQCEKALFFRAMLYKRADNMAGAVRDFRAVVDLHPRNVDAVRELRLFQMRGGRVSTEMRAVKSDDKGLIGKLFKR